MKNDILELIKCYKLSHKLNVQRTGFFTGWGISKSSARNRSPIEKLKMKISTKADRYSSAETESEQNHRCSLLFPLPNLHKTPCWQQPFHNALLNGYATFKHLHFQSLNTCLRIFEVFRHHHIV